MNIVTTGLLEPDRLAPSTHEAIRLAQEEAVRMQAQVVCPEHLLLGVVAQGENKAAKMMCRCGMDMLTIRVRATQVFGSQYVGADSSDLPLSKESLECVEWAISLVVRYMQPVLVMPEHLVLGVLRHPRIQSFLNPFSSSVEILRGYLSREMRTALIGYVEDPLLAPADAGEQQGIVNLRSDRSLWTLGTVERPDLTFASFGVEAKPLMQQVVEFLRRTGRSTNLRESGMLGIVLIGSFNRRRTYLIKATAGEAAVPLVSISIPALLQLHNDIAADSRRIESYGLPEHEYNFVKHGFIERYIRNIFVHARGFSPCILLIDDLDALNQIDKVEIRRRLLHQLSLDLKRLKADENRCIAVIITVSDRESYDSILGPSQGSLIPLDWIVNLQRPGRVQVWDKEITASSVVLAKRCPSCKKEALPGWKHCAYCGASLARTCPKCGAAQPEVEDAQYCFECGNPLEQEFEPVPEQSIEEIEKPETKIGFAIGQHVRVIDGPFTEYTGTITDIDMEWKKVTVLVTFFGHEKPVVLDFLQVEKI